MILLLKILSPHTKVQCSAMPLLSCPAYAIAANGACLHLLVPEYNHNYMYYSINRSASFQEKSTKHIIIMSFGHGVAGAHKQPD